MLLFHSFFRRCGISVAWVLLLVGGLLGCESPRPPDSAGLARPLARSVGGADELFQTGLLDAFLAGMLDGNYRVGDLPAHGDFGLGAFNHFDGEMVVLDGRVYQVKANGRAYPAADTLRTPFAFVNFFRPDTTFALPRRLALTRLHAYLDSVLRTTNQPLAIKLTGRFAYVKARSNPPIFRRPYPPVAAVIGQQHLFEFRQVLDTCVGYRLPPYVQGLNIPGYHFHFLTADRQAGGHVLALETDSVTVAVDVLRTFSVEVPTHPDFQRLDFSKNRQQELKKVE